MSLTREAVLHALKFQRDAIATSPMYQHLLEVVVDDVEAGGACALAFDETPAGVEPVLDALPLRFLGGVHRLVIEGRAPELAAFYPSVGGRFDADDTATLDRRFLDAVDAHHDDVVAALGRAVQTNEVGRCAALLLGFLEMARVTDLPLRTLEIGASAGLNLRWDRYRYEGGARGTAWGDPSSPVRFTDVYVEPLPDLDVDVVVAERAGCDRRPVDATSEDGALALRSFVWPDQEERFAALDAALRLAGDVPVTLEQDDAADWVERQLAEPRPGTATIVFHSIVWQYLPAATRHRLRDLIAAAGARAASDAPVAWLRMEPGHEPERGAEVKLTRWPGPTETVLARSGYHGRPVRPHPQGADGPTTR